MLSAMPFDPKLRRHISLASLLLTNFAVFVAVLLGKVSVQEVLLLYWAESAVIGFFTILRLLTLRAEQVGGESRVGRGIFARVFLAMFFCVHFGGFMVVHLVFLSAMLGMTGSIGGLPGVDDVSVALMPMLWGLAALFLSHLVSYVVHFLVGGERNRLDAGALFFAPYKRIMIMHVTILAGGFALVLLRGPIVLVALVVVLKTIVDAFAHVREHTALDSANGRAADAERVRGVESS